MRENALNSFTKLRTTWNNFTAGQRTVAIVGTAAVLLVGFVVFSWASKPTMTPLYSGLSSEDASAIVERLDADGITYELASGGSTIMVSRDQVYDTRIALSGDGLPSGSEDGYSILDEQGLSTSEFQQQTDFKRAMEGELSATIEAIDGINTAVVHLAIPEKQVFTETQEPTTASVLLDVAPGQDLEANNVQAIVNLVSSSVEGLDEENVSVSDAEGNVLKAPGDSEVGNAQGRDQQVVEFQNRLTNEVQGTLDRVLGAGNSTVTITPVLDFDKTSEQTTRYFGDPVTLAEATSEEILDGVGGGDDTRGILGPDGQTEVDLVSGTGQGGDGDYTNADATRDYGNNVTVEAREAAPGSVQSLHVGVMVDEGVLAGRSTLGIRDSIASSLGIDEARGDTLTVVPIAFDRSAEDAAAAELEAAAAAKAEAARNEMIRNGLIAGAIVLVVLLAWAQARRRAKDRRVATQYVVEQLKAENAARLAPPVPVEPEPIELESPAALALESAEQDETEEMKDQIKALVDRQPEEVADLLRGWLVG